MWKLKKGEHIAVCLTEKKKEAFLKLGFVAIDKPKKESKKD